MKRRLDACLTFNCSVWYKGRKAIYKEERERNKKEGKFIIFKQKNIY